MLTPIDPTLSPAEIAEITPLVEAAGVDLKAFLEAVQRPGFLGSRGKSLKQVLLQTSVQGEQEVFRKKYMLYYIEIFKTSRSRQTASVS